MNDRSKVLAPLASVVAVAAVAIAATLVAGDDSPRTPKLLRLAGAAGTVMRDAAPAFGGGGYRLVGPLPEGTPADAPAWNLPGGPGAAGPVARLAEALRAGTPERSGNGWSAAGPSGTLQVNGEPGRAWYFSFCPDAVVSSDSSPDRGAPDATSAPDVPPTPGEVAVGGMACAISGTGSVSSGSGSSGSSGSGTVISGTATAEPAPAPDQPVPAPGVPEQPLSISPPPPFPQKTPSQDAVRAAAAPVLEAVGLQDETARVTVYAGGGSVAVDPVVGGLDALGWTTLIAVNQDAKVVSGSGWLSSPDKADSYPLISARAAFEALAPMARILSCEMTPDGGCKEPAPIDITGAHLGLTVAQLADGGQVLLPAWLFDILGSPDPVAGVAVEPKYLGTGTDPGTEPTAPGTDPGTPVEPPSSGEPPPPAQPPSSTEPKPTRSPPSSTEPKPTRSPLAFDSAYRAKTANAVLVQYGDSSSCAHTGVTHAVKESADSVVVLLEADTMEPLRACTEDYRPVQVEVALQAPLGDRTVIDGSNGREVPLS